MNKQGDVRPQSCYKENKIRNGQGTAMAGRQGTPLDGVVKEGLMEEVMAR